MRPGVDVESLGSFILLKGNLDERGHWNSTIPLQHVNQSVVRQGKTRASVMYVLGS